MVGTGPLDEAINAYERSISLNSASLFAYMELGDLYAFYRGRFDKAMVYLRQAVALDPTRWRNSQRLWICYESLGQKNAMEEVMFWAKATQALADHLSKGMTASRDSALMEDKETWAKTYRQTVWEHAHWPMRSILLSTDLRAGRVDLALKLYQTLFPFVFEEEVVIGEPVMIYGHGFPVIIQAHVAMEVAEILIQKGDRERADYLLDQAWGWISKQPRLKTSILFVLEGIGIYDAVRFTLKGEKEKALLALREAINAGYRNNRPFDLSALDPLREEPEFIDMMEEIETDMAQQLANIRRMEANGELAAIPEKIRKLVEGEK